MAWWRRLDFDVRRNAWAALPTWSFSFHHIFQEQWQWAHFQPQNSLVPSIDKAVKSWRISTRAHHLNKILYNMMFSVEVNHAV
jgi:hypothetical protein